MVVNQRDAVVCILYGSAWCVREMTDLSLMVQDDRLAAYTGGFINDDS